MSLVVEGLVKRFGRIVALDGLAMEAPRGHVMGFLGSNGAGKTTTMRIALDVLRADRGHISWNGVDHRKLPRPTWGYLPEERGLYPKMAVLPQLVFFATLQGVPADVAAKRVREWLARLNVPDFADRRAEELSKGNQQKIQFLAAVLHDPEVLLLDEPFTGLDRAGRKWLGEFLLSFKAGGGALVVATHSFYAGVGVADRVAILSGGRIVLDRPAAELGLEDVRRLYDELALGPGTAS